MMHLVLYLFPYLMLCIMHDFNELYRSSLLMQQDFSFGLVRFSLDLGAIMCVLTHFIALVPLIFLAILKLDSNILVLVITFLGVVSIPFLYLA